MHQLNAGFEMVQHGFPDVQLFTIVDTSRSEQQLDPLLLANRSRLSQSPLFSPRLYHDVSQTVPIEVMAIRLCEKAPGPWGKELPLRRACPHYRQMVARMIELLAHFGEVGGCAEQHFQCAARDRRDITRISRPGRHGDATGQYIR